MKPRYKIYTETSEYKFSNKSGFLKFLLTLTAKDSLRPIRWEQVDTDSKYIHIPKNI